MKALITGGAGFFGTVLKYHLSERGAESVIFDLVTDTDKVKNTVLAEQVQRGEVELMERDQFVRTVVDFLEVLSPTMVIERIGGDAPPEFLVAPQWCLNRQATLAAVAEELQRRDTRQGARY